MIGPTNKKETHKKSNIQRFYILELTSRVCYVLVLYQEMILFVSSRQEPETYPSQKYLASWEKTVSKYTYSKV